MTGNQQIRRSIHGVVRKAVASLDIPGMVQTRQGYWVCRTGPQVVWEIQTLFETAHGAGMFRVGWCVRSPGAAAVLGLEDLPGTAHGTIGGDLGSFANRKRGMTMLCHEGAGTSLLSRLWWGVQETSPDQLTARVRSWLSTIYPILLPLGDRRAVADFVSGFGATYGRTDVYPEAEFGRIKTAIALRALESDVDWVRNALTSPESSIDYKGASDTTREIYREFIDNVDAALAAASAEPPD